MSTLSKSSKAPADWDPGKAIRLQFYNPIAQIRKPVAIYQDSILIGNMEVVTDTLDPRYVYLQYPFATDKQYQIYIPESGFTDIFGLSNLADTLSLNIRKEDAYSTLTILLTNKTDAPLHIALTKFDGTIVETWNIPVADSSNTPVSLKQKYLLPGIYRIQAVIDTDNNQTFTTGNLSERKQPERTLYYKTDQNLRANWENEIEWVLEK